MYNSSQQYAHLVLTFVSEINVWRDEYDPGTNEWLTLCALAEAAEQLALSVTGRPEPATQPDSLAARTREALFAAFSTRTLHMGAINCGSCGTGQFHVHPDTNSFECGTCAHVIHAGELDLGSDEAWAVDAGGILGKIANPVLAHLSMTAALSTWLTATERYIERQALVEFHRSALDLRTALSVGIPFPDGP